jgi:predicted DNA-binding protein
MPRVKTKGESIAFRLPVHLDDALNALAEDAGMTPRDFAAKIVEEYITQGEYRKPAQRANANRTGAAIAAEMFKR